MIQYHWLSKIVDRTTKKRGQKTTLKNQKNGKIIFQQVNIISTFYSKIVISYKENVCDSLNMKQL